jgi:hypothetical protein
VEGAECLYVLRAHYSMVVVEAAVAKGLSNVVVFGGALRSRHDQKAEEEE